MEVKNLDFSYGKNKVLDNVSLKIKRGAITTVIGANGCGKSTLFNVMTKSLTPQRGAVLLGADNIAEIPLKRFAQRVAVVHQYNTAPHDTSVRTLVGYGRLAHKSFMHTDRDEDERCIVRALQLTGIADLSECNISELSGGQRQRVWIAMAIAQNTDILFLDEPTTYLDIKYQIEILRLIKTLNKEHGMTVVMVLHDINQALYYSDEIAVMKNGRIIANGAADEVITSEIIFDTYQAKLNVEVINGRKYVFAV